MSNDAMSTSSQSDDDGAWPPTREELLDLAAVHALGLIDDAALEDRFLRGLDEAQPALQSEILERQAEWAADPAFLSAEPLPAVLRDRVLAMRPRPVLVGGGDDGTPLHGREWAAGGVIETREGDASGQGGSAVRGALGGFRFEMDAHGEVPAPLRKLIDHVDRQVAAAARGHSVTWLWRALALALAVGLVASLWFQLRLGERSAEIAGLALQRQTETRMRELVGFDLDRFLSGRSLVVGLDHVGRNGRGAAILYIDPVAGDGFLVVAGVRSEDGPFSLRLVRRDGGVRPVLGKMQPAGTLVGFAVPSIGLDSEAIDTLHWEVLNAAGEVLLRSS